MKWLINLLFGCREEPAPEPADEVVVTGLHVTGVRLGKDGGIEIVTGAAAVQDSNPLDEWMAKRARQAERH
jgi:hypothetical protein